MKKHCLLLIFTTQVLIITSASGCPCEFSPTDPRPFFEQYEKEIKPELTEKEKNYEKNNYSYRASFDNTITCLS